MTTSTRQLKRTVEAFARITAGKRFTIPTRKWIDPVDRTRSGFLRVDKKITTLRDCEPLKRRLRRSTADNVQMLVAVLRDTRKSGRLWLWIWDSDKGVHIIEPTGTDAKTLDADLASSPISARLKLPCAVAVSSQDG